MSLGQPAAFSYRADIDGLRAVAVLSVLAYHAFPGALRGGFIGVDIFFVISGFLITSIILGDLQRQRFSVLEFYRRRVRRIFPALLLVMTTVLVFGWFALLPQEYAHFGKHLAGGAGFVSNLMLWSESGYFDEIAETKLLLHLWSLAIEEQFYLVWPLLLALVFRRNGSLLLMSAAIIAASFGYSIWLIGQDPTAAFFSPLPRAWELIAGAGLAILASRGLVAGPALANALSAAGTACLALALWFITPKVAFPGWWATLPVLGTALVIAAGPAAALNRLFYAARPMVWVGLISYPLYLWHWPLISYAYIEEGAKPATAIRAAAALIAILLAFLTYRYVERPIRRGWGGTRTFPGLLIVMASLGLIGAGLAALDGIPARVPSAQNAQKSEEPQLPSDSTQACRSRFPELASAKYCYLFGQGEPELAIVGDSHALQYAEALAAQIREKPFVLIAHTGCLPFSTRARHELPACAGVMEATSRFIASKASIRQVVLAGHWGYLSSGGFATVRGSAWRLPLALSAEREQEFVELARQFLAPQQQPGREWIALLDVPYLDFNINKCVVERPLNWVSRPVERCGVERARHEQTSAGYERALRAALAGLPGSSLHDPKPLLCDSSWCSAVREGPQGREALYADGDHLNRQGTELVIRELAARHGWR
ncbi:MAG: acyltransferase [Rubrivivax sp.]|nr:acyltransferase [Rubrivivax sp.]